MSSMGAVHLPATGKLAEFHDSRFEAFETLQQTARVLRT